MWRQAKVSYLQYSNEMAQLLRESLKEPFRSTALQRNQVHFKESIFQNGSIVSREIVESFKQAFGKGSGAK
uniref:Uncharacterized protein n=1 Tax=Chromera velia CCMP2878 TaxID=1169474 RepID=A0A0G4FJL9_9ALVE|eukprot:Cvel_17380.t1-p1 / transcript=Cvel_17380.t1 / gene=Cvel_17380 / organism=Chromera_velia_CCMP2878 / gene_product=ATP synthase subunit epsilon, mitochondrial, putative / transcript_product=ATP synthase subunit epsilon, mitochondrial, putative / location=Cvel_scaffold1382:35728-38677(-) / protein_length=70 / sequence_SO=supercontig / SO=protein_coding / is_pseudo=false